MEPRELWERNTLLAEAFCGADDWVRKAQSAMDEALASRTRVLAAFAVTVGSDTAVANLMGLGEREVRLARRTVGKDDARDVANQLLSTPAARSAPAETNPLPDGPGPESAPEPVTTWEGERQAEGAETFIPHPRAQTPAPASWTQTHAGAAPPEDTVVSWNEHMDSVLQWSWRSGLDMRTVAGELGLSPQDIFLRAQLLAAENRLMPSTPSSHETQPGRHRRHEAAHNLVNGDPRTLFSTRNY
ncbi:hypothetical protein ACWIG4_05355 [Streptomyces sp. NPDC002248]